MLPAEALSPQQTTMKHSVLATTVDFQHLAAHVEESQLPWERESPNSVGFPVQSIIDVDARVRVVLHHLFVDVCLFFPVQTQVRMTPSVTRKITDQASPCPPYLLILKTETLPQTPPSSLCTTVCHRSSW